MEIRVDLHRLAKTKLHEYALRFLSGGLTTALIGMIAHRYGPVTGGLFLAFPSIFLATTTLVENHEIRRKKRAGMNGHNRGREAVGLDAAGAALGSLGLMVFGVIVWQLIAERQPSIVLVGAIVVWLVVAALA
jgi:Protein of unknown function (DUF3147)